MATLFRVFVDCPSYMPLSAFMIVFSKTSASNSYLCVVKLPSFININTIFCFSFSTILNCNAPLVLTQKLSF